MMQCSLHVIVTFDPYHRRGALANLVVKDARSVAQIRIMCRFPAICCVSAAAEQADGCQQQSDVLMGATIRS